MVWAQNVGQQRMGVLAGDRLLLFGPSGLLIVRLDVPFKSKAVSATGAFVGLAGRTACLLQASHLALIDVVSGDVKTFPLKDITEGRGAVQAALDGLMVYVTGPKGILCVNARTRQSAFTASWPAALAPGKAQARNADAQGVTYALHWLQHQAGGRTVLLPLLNRAYKGVLYARVSRWRIAALAARDTRAADGRREE